MTTRNTLLQALPLLFDDWRSHKQKLQALNKKPIDTDVREKFEKNIQQDIRTCWERINQALEEYDTFPERFDKHLDDADEFWKTANFDSSVFIMTKYPDDADLAAKHPDALALQHLIDCVVEAVKAQGYAPRLANKDVYKDWLWANVEFQLLCCRSGVAILEDKVRPELNPNVALEWGWMLGMGREVIYLREKNFAKERADFFGRISHEFDWDDPKPGILDAIKQRLPDRAKLPRG